MADSSEFDDICPYDDEEAVKALNKVANHPMALLISEYLFPDEPVTYLRDSLRQVHSVDEFQEAVMNKAVQWCVDHTIHNFSYDGISYIKEMKGKFLAISNHRDIILDPAITQMVLFNNGIPMTEICVGDNLIRQSKTIEYLLRSNRMIKVIRGISARELYLSSQVLSKYIRQTITSGKASIWLAQRQGRTKDGIDTTEQGLLKMLDMSGEKTFQENFRELNIVPLSISYEYEPCDIRKAREILISRTRKYEKTHYEDMHSIVMGIRQQKGDVHLNFGLPISEEEIEMASRCDKNDRYQAIRHAVDKRVIAGYRLWRTNYIAYDLIYGTKYADLYNKEDIEKFTGYMAHRMGKVEKKFRGEELKDIFLRIYANPVVSKERLASGEPLRQD